MSPNTKIIQSDLARQRQAMRDLDGLPWAARPSISVGLSKLVIFGLTPICVIAWLVSR
jgi:hypothetical protein